MDSTPHNEATIDPVAKAIAMLDMLSPEAQEQVLGRMAPDVREQIVARRETTPEGSRPHDAFHNDVVARRQMIRDVARRVHERRIETAESTGTQIAQGVDFNASLEQQFDPLGELRRVHPAALARAMQGERAEAWAVVLDRLEDNARMALTMYLDTEASAAIAAAAAQQSTLAPSLRSTIEKAIATTVVPRALREHQMLLTTHPEPDMAQLFKGHHLDDGNYPIPSDQRQPVAGVPAAAAPQEPSIDAKEIKRAAADMQEIVAMVGSMGPQIAQISDALQVSSQQQGYADGISRAQAEVQQQLMDAITALTEAQQQRHDIALQNEPALAELAMRIARKVIGAHLVADDALVGRIVASTIAELEPTTAIVVKVHPDDLPAVEANRTEIERLVTGKGTVELAADATVDRGGCILSSPVGDVDARIDTKLAVLETAFAAQRRKLIEGP